MDYTNVVGQRRVNLVPDESVVAFRAGQTATATLTRNLGEHVSRRVSLKGEGLTLLKLQEPASRDVVQDTVEGHRTAEAHKACFRMGGHHIVAGNDVMVAFKPGARRSRILSRAKVVTQEKLGNIHVVEHQEGRPFDIAEDLRDEPDVAWAEPHFTSVHYRPHVSGALTQAPTPARKRPPKGYEIRLTQIWNAWALQPGDPKIKIAVIDEGIQVGHPSIEPIIVGTYDAANNRGRQYPKPWDYHGTACAGIAVSAPGSGPVRGFGGGCGLLAVRMGYTSDAKNQALVTKALWMVRALNWACQKGASVLSCSWSAGEQSNALIQAIGEARAKGRRGKGCIVVFAAGNESQEVNFPGLLPGVVTVSASNQFDEPKTGMGNNSEKYWGTNFGPEVDLAAPGIGISTIDNRGDAGKGVGDFISDFNGTSSATPMVAGVAGLVLSANPSLTEEEVKTILRESADKVGSVPYVDGRNDMMGWGRVNALAAVTLARP